MICHLNREEAFYSSDAFLTRRVDQYLLCRDYWVGQANRMPLLCSIVSLYTAVLALDQNARGTTPAPAI